MLKYKCRAWMGMDVGMKQQIYLRPFLVLLTNEPIVQIFTQSILDVITIICRCPTDK